MPEIRFKFPVGLRDWPCSGVIAEAEWKTSKRFVVLFSLFFHFWMFLWLKKKKKVFPDYLMNSSNAGTCGLLATPRNLVAGNTFCGHRVAPKLAFVRPEQASLNQGREKWQDRLKWLLFTNSQCELRLPRSIYRSPGQGGCYEQNALNFQLLEPMSCLTSPFFSPTLGNMFRLYRLTISSFLPLYSTSWFTLVPSHPVLPG